MERIAPPVHRPVRLQRPTSAKGLQQAPVQAPAPICAIAKRDPSRSIGAANDGTLRDGCRLPMAGAGYVGVGERVWGADATVAWLQWAAAQVALQFPGSAPLVIGALSAENGGFIAPHKSHQSGRDADIGYFHTARSQARRFELTTADNLDAEKTWAFLEALLYTGDVTFIFMDYEIQASMYEALIDNGWTEATLAPLFQYPAGPSIGRGIIRHAKGHADHFHVRLRCVDADKPDCID